MAFRQAQSLEDFIEHDTVFYLDFTSTAYHKVKYTVDGQDYIGFAVEGDDTIFSPKTMLSRKRPYWYEVDDPRPGDKIFGKDITPDIAVGTSRVPLQPPFEDNKLYLIIKDPLHPIDTVQEAVKHDTVIDNYGNAWHHFIGETFTGKPTDYFVSKYDEVITPHELLDLRSIGYEITSRGYGQAHGIAQRKDTR